MSFLNDMLPETATTKFLKKMLTKMQKKMTAIVAVKIKSFYPFSFPSFTYLCIFSQLCA